MTTQNVQQTRITFTDLAAGTYYGPYVNGVLAAAGLSATSAKAYIDMNGYDHLGILLKLVAGANDSVALTVESDDGTTLTFTLDDTLGAYDSTTNTQNASYTAANSTIYAHLHLDDCNGRFFHVKLEVVGGESNSGIITFRKTKV